MKVVHVNDIAYVASILVHELRTAGVDASLLIPDAPGASWPYPQKLATIPLRAWILATAGARLRRPEIDIVHVHYATHALTGLVSGRPYVVHCHGSDVRGVSPSGPTGKLLASLLARASAVLYATPDLAPWAERLRPGAAFLPNPVDTASFAPEAAKSVDVLVGTKLDPIKGSKEIVDVLRGIRSIRPQTTFTIINQGSGLADAVSAAGANAAVIEPVPHREMPALLRRHRTAIGQFRLGILSQVELEAIASGVPVATAFRYEAAYEVRPPLMAAATAQQAARSIASLLDDRDSRSALGFAGRSWVIENHEAGAIARRLLRIYDSVRRERPRDHPRNSG